MEEGPRSISNPSDKWSSPSKLTPMTFPLHPFTPRGDNNFSLVSPTTLKVQDYPDVYENPIPSYVSLLYTTRNSQQKEKRQDVVLTIFLGCYYLWVSLLPCESRKSRISLQNNFNLLLHQSQPLLPLLVKKKKTERTVLHVSSI